MKADDGSGLDSLLDFVSRGSDDWPFQCLPHQSVFGGGCCQAGAVGAVGAVSVAVLFNLFPVFKRFNV